MRNTQSNFQFPIFNFQSIFNDSIFNELNNKAMHNISSLSINKKYIILATQFAVLLAVAATTPALIHSQPITGPIVNATLFLAVVLLGAQNAILLGLLPSIIALSVGLLPSPLAPMIPFIMLGNTILIITFSYLRKRNYWLAIISAGLLKFLFLYSTSFIVVNLITKQAIAQKAASMLSWPQLLTALSGGIIAYFILNIIKRSRSTH